MKPKIWPALVWGWLWLICANSRAFGGLWGVLLGHIVGLEGTKGLFDTRKSSYRVECTCHFSSFARFEWALELS